MRAFPLNLLRPLTLLIREAEPFPDRRQEKVNRVVFLFNALCAQREPSLKNWEMVLKRAEVLGELIHEIDVLMNAALRRHGLPAGRILQHQDSLLGASSPEKISSVLASLMNDLRKPVVRN